MPRLTDAGPARRICEFFGNLYAMADRGSLEVRGIKTGEDRACISEWFPLVGGQSSIRAASAYASQLNQNGFDAFFGVNPRVNGGLNDKDVLSGVATWVDIDGIPDLGAAEATLAQMECPVPPDMAVYSGAGLHVYWILSEPYDPANDDWIYYRSSLKAAAEFYNGDRQSTNVGRVLRFPLSYSHKRGCFTKLWLRGEA